jgi:hypothetical protein
MKWFCLKLSSKICVSSQINQIKNQQSENKCWLVLEDKQSRLILLSSHIPLHTPANVALAYNLTFMVIFYFQFPIWRRGLLRHKLYAITWLLTFRRVTHFNEIKFLHNGSTYQKGIYLRLDYWFDTCYTFVSGIIFPGKYFILYFSHSFKCAYAFNRVIE